MNTIPGVHISSLISCKASTLPSSSRASLNAYSCSYATIVKTKQFFGTESLVKAGVVISSMGEFF